MSTLEYLRTLQESDSIDDVFAAASSTGGDGYKRQAVV